MALTSLNQNWTRGEHITFRFNTMTASGKTKVFDVLEGRVGVDVALTSKLGEVRWFSHWRCYAFFPSPACIFEKTCLRDIAEFCESQTKVKRES